ncbi:Ribosomal protein S4, bacterial-type [Candidatus Omnitrophus magneticus]|uniref:Small ribosomal subunit protein uS4 n=1 Tax=Candidatus Omnitrophus magneticus TaxID=1609969 RepID=A0A0F0CLZ4_9BACT|nr:Ribosomal protein S4, bacterial-type [Candidatus Omnitrophus magneticus]
MARTLGAKCRQCRREGEKLFLKGGRCKSDKCILNKRDYAPGQHGQGKKRKGKASNYAVQLREKQKTKRIYGLLERQFKNYFKKAEQTKGVTGETLLSFLEMRLDNIIYRARFAESRAKARQLVGHRFVKVNGHIVNIPSFLIKEGDEIIMFGTDAQIKMIKDTVKLLEDRSVPEWLEVADDTLKIKVKRLPVRADVGLPIEENLIVELYSK